LLYLDRACIAFLEKYIKEDLRLSDGEMSWVISAFFWAYALAQVPAGWLADRFGRRLMLTVFVIGWSAFTGLTGAAWCFTALLAVRFGCGLAQAGAYPTAAGLVSRWVPFGARGMSSGIISFGGRLGGTAAPVVSAFLISYRFGWDDVLYIYCAVGLVAALFYWLSVADTPRDHGWCSEAECELIEGVGSSGSGAFVASDARLPFGAMVRNRSLWLSCIAQFGTNFGWIFLMSWLPRYLLEVHEVEDVLRGILAGIPFFVGWVGMLSGGRLTDWLTSRLGLRWGRGLPMSVSRFVAMAAYLACLLPLSPYAATAAFSVVAFSTDIGTASVWAFKQDVGGRHVGSILGWGNMWGNIGAALSPVVLRWLVDRHDSWDAAFLACAAAFLVSGLAALGVDATKRIVAPNSR